MRSMRASAEALLLTQPVSGGQNMKSTFQKPTVIAVLLAAVALQFLGSPLPTVAQNPPNVTSEARALGQFGKGLADFLNLANTLRAKASRSTSDISSLESNASRVKSSVSGFRSNLEAFIKKHKDAGQWNAQFDTALENKLAPELKNFARQNGGARRLFELGLSEINNFIPDIDEATNSVKRLSISSAGRDAELVRVAYRPEPLFKVRAKCIGLFIASAASSAAGFDLGESEANKAFEKNKCGSFGDAT
jgi:hypothetical protein